MELQTGRVDADVQMPTQWLLLWLCRDANEAAPAAFPPISHPDAVSSSSPRIAFSTMVPTEAETCAHTAVDLTS